MNVTDWTSELLDKGYCIIPHLVPEKTIRALGADLEPVFAATPFGQGHFYGFRTKRFGGLLKRSRHAEALVMQPDILAIVEAVLGGACERIQLNVAQAIEIHPGERQQFPHRDPEPDGLRAAHGPRPTGHGSCRARLAQRHQRLYRCCPILLVQPDPALRLAMRAAWEAASH